MGVYIENDLNTFGVATAGTKKKWQENKKSMNHELEYLVKLYQL